VHCTPGEYSDGRPPLSARGRPSRARRPLPDGDRGAIPAVRALGVALLLFATTAEASPRSDRVTILGTIHRMEAAWNRSDFAGYMAGFKNPDVVFVSGGKFQDGWQGTLNHYIRDYGGSPERRGHLHFYNMNLDLLAHD